MTGVIKSVIAAIVGGILVFFGTVSLLLLLSLLIAYYDLTMENVVKSCESCYYPQSSIIVTLCLVVAIVAALFIFVGVKRYEAKGPPPRFVEELRRELHEAGEDLRHKADETKQVT